MTTMIASHTLLQWWNHRQIAPAFASSLTRFKCPTVRVSVANLEYPSLVADQHLRVS